MKKRFRSIAAVLFVFILIAMMFETTTVNAATTTNEPVGAQQKAMFIMDTVNISQGMYGSYSHQGSKAIDLAGRDGGIDPAYAPFDGKVVYMSTSAAYIIFQSLNPVEFADGTVDYMTIWVMHDDNVARFYVGQTFSQGQHFFNEGSSGYATGNHIHLECAKGTYEGQFKNDSGVWCIKNQINPYDALFLSESTNIIDGYGYNWRRTNRDSSAPTISNARAENMSANSFDIKCDLNDDVGVTRVWLNIYGPSGQNGYEVSASNGAFSHRISTQGYGGAGLYSVHIYAFDAAGHQTSAAVGNIQAINDTVAPTITNAKAINPSVSEFTITCQLNDNVGVTRVYVIVFSPDGTMNNGYDVAASNGTFSHTIKTAQYGGAGVYKVHLYAFDAAGNQAPCAINNIEAVNDTTAPTITDAKAVNPSSSEFTITCQLNDNVGVTRVYVIVFSPDGTMNNGYDVAASNGTFSHTIKTAQYGGSGVYKVHLYVFDAAGNQAPCAINDIIAKNDAISPEITEAKAINANASEFTISCQLYDNIGVTRVYVIVFSPDGTMNNGYDVSASNGTFSHIIKTAQYGGAGVYKVHLYAFDAEGNQAPCAINNIIAKNDPIPPEITEARAINTSASEFTITCQLNDNVGVTRVYVIVYNPNGTQNNGYDVSASNGVFSHTIKTKDYAGEGVYKVHLYAFDADGNQAPCAINNIYAYNHTLADTNLDGHISISDVTAIQRHLAELEVFNDEQFALADTNGDGEINIADATHLQMYLAEFDVVLGSQT